MGVESVSVAVALSHADTHEISCHSPTRVLLPALESMESKSYTSYRSYSTNVYIQNHWSTALKLLWKTAPTQFILSPETPWTLYNYVYLEDYTAYHAKYWWYNGTQNKKQKTSKTCAIQYPTNRNPAQSLKENEITVFIGLACTTRRQKKRETSKVLKLKNSNLSSKKFLELIPDKPKMPNYVTASRSNSILDQLTHLRAHGIYQSGGVPDSAMEQS